MERAKVKGRRKTRKKSKRKRSTFMKWMLLKKILLQPNDANLYSRNSSLQ
jgi:hypothetical protein